MPAHVMTMEVGTLAQWAGAAATFLAVLVALFRESAVRWFRRPRLIATIRLAAPNCVRTPMYVEAGDQILEIDCYYFRLLVENQGRGRAELVQVYAGRLLRRNAGNEFIPVDEFLPLNLRWAHSPLIFADINPRMGRHCDLGHVVDPQSAHTVGDSLPNVPPGTPLLHLDLEVVPATRSHLLTPGTYRLQLQIAAANSRAVTTELEITLNGWYENQEQMFSRGVGIVML
jgi:hypothetical protein